MDAPGLAAFIAESKLFGMLDGPGRSRLIEAAEEQSFESGSIVLMEGDHDSHFFLLVSGAVRVTASGFTEAKELARLGAGAIFGEIAALTGEPRTATVTADGPIRALRFERDEVMAVLAEYPEALGMLNRIGLMRSEDTLEKMLVDD